MRLAKRLAAMVRDGQAIEGPNGFATAGDGERVAGRIRGRANGEVLVLPDDGSAPLVLARADTATLMHNDRVEVLAVGMNERGRRIARLIRRTGDAPARIGGVWHAGHGTWPGRAGGSGSLVFGRGGHAQRARRRRRRQCHRRDHQAAAGRRARARPHRRSARKTCVPRISRRALPFCGTICRRNSRPTCCMRRICSTRTSLAADRAGREDLRDLPLVTIDGEDAKDFDDAVYAESVRGGGWRLVVAIADVSHYVRVGSALDAEARARATSVYFPDRVLPMLPEHLSNHLCSLMPHVERLAFVCDMRVSKSGKLGRTRFYEAVIRSHARLTYDQAWAYLENPEGAAGDDLAPEVRASLQNLYAVYGALKTARDARGALDFRGGEVKARIGDNGKIEGFYAVMRNDAHRLIEECMIAANVEAAVALRLAKAGSLYRVHGQPEEKRVTELQKVMNALQVGATFSESPTPARISPVGRAAGRAARWAAARGLGDPLARSGGVSANEHRSLWPCARRVRALHLADPPLSRICWCIAPSRRPCCRTQPPGTSTAPRNCRPSARRVRSASGAPMMRRATSWDISNACICSRASGETFDATISSALEFGLFVQLKEMPIDGLVHISAIPGDYWELESGGMGLVGQRTGRRWQMGDSGAGAPQPGRPDAAPNRFRIARRGRGRVAWHGARAAARRPEHARGAGRAQLAAAAARWRQARRRPARGAAGATDRAGRG